MSRKRLVWSAVVLACVMGGAIAGAVAALPLVRPARGAAADAQDAVDGKAAGVTLPKVVWEVKPQYTPEAMTARIEGTVIMTVVVRTDGTPSEIEITKSPDAEYGLDEQSVAALGQWRSVEMRFTLRK